MIGWLGDFFRFWWALFYWNTRKTWFRVRGAERDSCPCQTYGDSGHALDSRCDAVIHWHQPVRFRRVCPLLQETPEGWRCSVDAERVRPFWGRAALYCAGFLLAAYLAATLAAFTFLRLAKYDITYSALLWPPRWGEVRGAQEKLYARRVQQAMSAGNYPEAILALEMICQLNPRNYQAGLALASLARVAARPFYSESVYERLMRDVPEQRIQTAQLWYRTMLAGAAYDKIKPLAATMLVEDASQRGAWLNALLFAARQTNDSQVLTTLLDQGLALPDWCLDLITIERGLLQKHLAEVLPRLTRVHQPAGSPYVPYFQVDRLLLHGRPDQALALLDASGGALPPDEISFLHLRIDRAKGWKPLYLAEQRTLLDYALSPRLCAQFSAFLISDPEPGLLAAYFDKFMQEGPRLTAETLPLFDAAYLAAVLANDKERTEKIAAQLMQFTHSDVRVQRGLADLLLAGQMDSRLARILPLVPLPTEAVYAVLARPAALEKK